MKHILFEGHPDLIHWDGSTPKIGELITARWDYNEIRRYRVTDVVHCVSVDSETDISSEHSIIIHTIDITNSSND